MEVLFHLCLELLQTRLFSHVQEAAAHVLARYERRLLEQQPHLGLKQLELIAGSLRLGTGR